MIDQMRVLKSVFICYLVFVAAITICSHYRSFLIAALGFSALLLIFHRGKSARARKPYFSLNTSKLEEEQPQFMPLVYGAIVFVLSMLYWLGFYPGGFNLDAYGQWAQVHGIMQYNDWHPFVSTLIIWLVTRFFDSFEFYIFVQIACFSISVSYMLYGFQKVKVNYRWLIADALYIGINPAIMLNIISLSKDAQFAVFVVLLTGAMIRMVSSEGRWVYRPGHAIFLSLLLTHVSLVRHNGFLLTIPAGIILILTFRSAWKRIGSIIIAALLMIVFAKTSLNRVFNVENHDNVVGETVGIPMSMMANSLVSDPENIPEDVHAFLNTIADDSMWAENYVLGEWDSCKWVFGGTELLKDTSLEVILRYTASTIVHCPQACYDAFRANTRIVWSCFGSSSNWATRIYVEDNDLGINFTPIEPLQTVLNYWIAMTTSPVMSFLFWHIGAFVVVYILAWMINIDGKQKDTITIFFPLFIYTVETMLLLSAPSHRYFFSGLIVLPLCLLYHLSSSENGTISDAYCNSQMK